MKLNPSQLWKVLSLLVPVPEGYAVGIAIWEVLHWDYRIVWVSSAIVALTGFLAIDTTNRMSEFNDTLTDEEKQQKIQAPVWRGFIVLAIWFVGVTILTVLLEIVSWLAIWTPIGLVVVGSSAAWLRSINKGQEAREQAREQFRAERKQELSKQEELARKQKEDDRNERKAARKAREEARKREATIKQAIAAKLQAKSVPLQGSKSVDLSQLGNTQSQTKTRATRKGIMSDEQLIFEYQINPAISSSELAAKFGVSRQAIDQRRNALAESGILDLTKDEKSRVTRVEVMLRDWVSVGQGSG